MSKFVVINIDEGSFEEGFTVRLEIGEYGRIQYKTKVKLTPAPDIPPFYQDWQNKYRKLGKTIRQINIPEAQVTHLCVVDDEKFARERFESYLKQWFAQLSWRELRVSIEEKTQPHELIRVIIDTKNIYLKKLPWHLWQLFQKRPQAEFALSAEFAPPSESLKRPVKILAIFGGSEGLDLTSDRDLMTKLRRRGATVTWLEQPQRDELSRSLWEQHWDILFFAGHSSSGEQFNSGEIQINDSESISLTRLRNALRIAVQNGLKLAIFNSCDGLGLADELIGVKVPQMIVMREPVPDEVARQFLQYFLEDFSQGHSLYLAVRNARQRLEWMEDKFPCASWLPVICQNPAARPFVWAKKSIFDNKIAVLTGISFSFIAAIAFIYFSLIDRNIGKNYNPSGTKISERTSPKTPPPNSKTILKDLGDDFSWGERILITSKSNKLKREGIEAFSEGKYEKSIILFYQSLQRNPNDPETLIYLNNAVSMEASEIDRLPAPTTSNRKKCKSDNPNPLKIAVIAPKITGLRNQINQEILQGVAQAQNEINLNCGIEDRMLQVVIVNDYNEPNKSSRVAQILVDEKDILAVVGHYSSDATVEAGKVYQNKMVVVSPTSTAVRISAEKQYGLNLTKYIFRTATNDEITIKNLVDYMVKRGKKKASIVYNESSEYSKNFRQELKKQLESSEIDGKLIDVLECKIDSSLNPEECLQKSEKQVSILVLAPPTDERFNQILDILNKSKDFNLTLLGGDSLYGEGENARNLVIAVPWFQNQSNQSEFERNAVKLWDTKKLSWHTAMSYDAIMAIVEGLRRIIREGKKPTAQELQKVLSAEDFTVKGAAGNIEFDRNGDRKITLENNDQIGVLVQVKCDTKNNCKFDPIPPQ